MASETTVVLVAPAPFKGALSAPDAARAIAAGCRLVPGVRTEAVPVADGGEGTLDALVSGLAGHVRAFPTTDPLGRPIEGAVGVAPGGFGVVELARASGYERLRPGERDPERTSSYGTGTLIRAALDLGVRTLVVGVGGSATNDGGLGLALALGARALDGDGRALEGVGADLGRVARLDMAGLDPRLAAIDVRVACDVTSPFTGPSGATHVFGPQKGADAAACARLEAGMARFAEVLGAATGTDPRGVARAGAAGGAAGGLLAIAGARLLPGAELVLEAVGFADRLRGADLCVTGEGALDAQSLTGKAPFAVAAEAGHAGVPCVALCGRVDLGPGGVRDAGLVAALPIGRAPRTVPDALAETERDLAAAGAALAGLWRAPVR